MTVLIADNDRAVSGLLTEVLKRSGLQLMHAFDGDEARRLARDPAVRVLVCDLDMPGASGLEVLESLCDLSEPPRSIVISGYLDTAIEARLRAMACVREVLRKPFDLLVFAAIVRRLAAEHQPDTDRQVAPEGEAAAGKAPDDVQAGRREGAPGEVRSDARGEGSGGGGVAVEH